MKTMERTHARPSVVEVRQQIRDVEREIADLTALRPSLAGRAEIELALLAFHQDATRFAGSHAALRAHDRRATERQDALQCAETMRSILEFEEALVSLRAAEARYLAATEARDANTTASEWTRFVNTIGTSGPYHYMNPQPTQPERPSAMELEHYREADQERTNAHVELHGLRMFVQRLIDARPSLQSLLDVDSQAREAAQN